MTDDLLQLITPHQTLYERVKAIRGGKKKKGIYYKLMAMKHTLESNGKYKQFAVICTASIVLFTAGIFLSIVKGEPAHIMVVVYNNSSHFIPPENTCFTSLLKVSPCLSLLAD